MGMALQAQQLCVSLNGRQVLHDVSLALPAGRWTSVVGPNGAGKSTLLKALAGLLPGHADVQLFDVPLTAIGKQQRACRLAWLGQNETTSDDLRVWDIVMLGRLPHQPWLSGSGPQDERVVQECLHSTQSWDLRMRSLGQLSGGERQRVLLARALAVQADVLLMDEPLVNLDPPHQVDWLQQVRSLVAQGKTVVSVLHEIGMALHADDVVVMREGRVMHHGPCADAATQRAIEAVFDHRIAIHAVAGEWVTIPRREA